MNKAYDRRNGVRAFTLIEMLVAVAILALLVVFIAQLMRTATAITGISGKRMDSDGQVRAIFDRMANDFSGMIKRQDVDYLFTKNPGNDTMYFFSEATKYFDSSIPDYSKSTLTLVGYRINQNLQLERVSRGLTWDGTPAPSSTISPTPSPAPGSMIFLTPSGSSTPFTASTIVGNWASIVGSSPTYSNGQGPDYHVIGDQVYRLEISFVQAGGTLSNAVTAYNGLLNVIGVNVALGMLDNASRTLILQSGQIPSGLATSMINALPDSLAGTPTLTTWKSSSYLTSSGLPQPVTGQLRIYERTLYFGNP